MQHQPEPDDAQHQPDPLQSEHHEGSRRGQDVVDLRAAVATEKRREILKRHILDADQQQPARDIAQPMRQRHHQRRDHDRDVEHDRGLQLLEVGERLLEPIDGGGERNEIGDHIEDLEPPLHVRRVSRRTSRRQPRAKLPEGVHRTEPDRSIR